MPYPFKQIFAADPSTPDVVAANSEVTIFAPGDVSRTPLAITDPTGVPLPNPIRTDEKGFASAFIADIPQVAWEGAGLTGLLESFEGMRVEAAAAAVEAVSARHAAEAAAEAATTAAATAAAQVSVELGGTLSAVQQAAADAAAAAQLVDAPAGTVIRSIVSGDLDDPVSGLATRLSAAYGVTESIGKHGGKVDGTTDDTWALLSAITEAKAHGGGTVTIPGISKVAPFILPAGVQVIGIGFGSTLKHAGGAGTFVTLKDPSTDLTGIRDITLDCSAQTSGRGIDFTNSATGYATGWADSHHLVQNVNIVRPAGDGIYMSAQSRENRIINVNVRDPRAGHAFNIQGTDNFFSLCSGVATKTPYHGWNVVGASNRFLGCKAFYCGKIGEASDGWNITGPRTTLAGCESQDNGRFGFQFSSVAANTAAGQLVADGNGAAGIVFDNTSGGLTGLAIEGMLAISRNGARYPQAVGVRFVAKYPTDSSITGTSVGNTATDVEAPANVAESRSRIEITAKTGDRAQRTYGSRHEFTGGPVVARAGAYGTVENIVGAELIHGDDSDAAGTSSIDLRMGFRSAVGAMVKWAGLRAVRAIAFAGNIDLDFMTTYQSVQYKRATLKAAGYWELNNVPVEPPANPNGVIYYASAGQLICKGSNGTKTVLGPA